MPTITTKDGVEIFYKDWGKGQPIVFSHGWPLSSDDWDPQMMFFLNHGFRVIAHDRRGHGRSSQTADGHDMDHYADDLAAVVRHLDLEEAIHVGHSTGGGEVVHYLAPWRGPRQKGRDPLRGAALDDEDAGQSEWHSEGSLRWIPVRACERPLAILSRRRRRPVLWLQQAGCKTVGGRDRELVASGHDGWRESALRRHRRLLADRLHRGPEEDQASGAGDAQRGRRSEERRV